MREGFFDFLRSARWSSTCAWTFESRHGGQKSNDTAMRMGVGRQPGLQADRRTWRRCAGFLRDRRAARCWCSPRWNLRPLDHPSAAEDSFGSKTLARRSDIVPRRPGRTSVGLTAADPARSPLATSPLAPHTAGSPPRWPRCRRHRSPWRAPATSAAPPDRNGVPSGSLTIPISSGPSPPPIIVRPRLKIAIAVVTAVRAARCRTSRRTPAPSTHRW